MPKLCMTRTINLSNTQFRYQLDFWVHTYGYIWLASFVEAKFVVASFAQAKHARRCFAWLHDTPNTTSSAPDDTRQTNCIGCLTFYAQRAKKRRVNNSRWITFYEEYVCRNERSTRLRYPSLWIRSENLSSITVHACTFKSLVFVTP